MTHFLKTLPIYFNRTWELEKQFEIRKNDRGFQTGDKITLTVCYGFMLVYLLLTILK